MSKYRFTDAELTAVAYLSGISLSLGQVGLAEEDDVSAFVAEGMRSLVARGWLDPADGAITAIPVELNSVITAIIAPVALYQVIRTSNAGESSLGRILVGSDRVLLHQMVMTGVQEVTDAPETIENLLASLVAETAHEGQVVVARLGPTEEMAALVRWQHGPEGIRIFDDHGEPFDAASEDVVERLRALVVAA